VVRLATSGGGVLLTRVVFYTRPLKLFRRASRSRSRPSSRIVLYWRPYTNNIAERLAIVDIFSYNLSFVTRHIQRTPYGVRLCRRAILVFNVVRFSRWKPSCYKRFTSGDGRYWFLSVAWTRQVSIVPLHRRVHRTPRETLSSNTLVCCVSHCFTFVYRHTCVFT